MTQINSDCISVAYSSIRSTEQKNRENRNGEQQQKWGRIEQKITSNTKLTVRCATQKKCHKTNFEFYCRLTDTKNAGVAFISLYSSIQHMRSFFCGGAAAASSSSPVRFWFKTTSLCRKFVASSNFKHIRLLGYCCCYCGCRCYDYYYFCYDYLSSICGNNKVRLVSFFSHRFPLHWNGLFVVLFDAAFSFIFMLAFGIGPTNLYLFRYCQTNCSIEDLFLFLFLHTKNQTHIHSFIVYFIHVHRQQ